MTKTDTRSDKRAKQDIFAHEQADLALQSDFLQKKKNPIHGDKLYEKDKGKERFHVKTRKSFP